MMDGNHIRSWSKEEAAKVPALAEQARLCERYVYVGSDIGFLTIWGVGFQKPSE